MTVEDRTRLNLHRKLEAVLGPEEADTLMAHLPPVTWQDVATKSDLGATGAMLRADLRATEAAFGTELAHVRTELRTELADVRTELRTELADVRTELRTGLGDVRTGLAEVRTELRTGLAEVRTDVSRAIDRQTRWMVTFICAWSTVVVAAARLLF